MKDICSLNNILIFYVFINNFDFLFVVVDVLVLFLILIFLVFSFSLDDFKLCFIWVSFFVN